MILKSVFRAVQIVDFNFEKNTMYQICEWEAF